MYAKLLIEWGRFLKVYRIFFLDFRLLLEETLVE